MKTEQLQINAIDCPIDEIAAYIDGESKPVRELELDVHFANCRKCSFELNQQKQFLCSLNSSLNQEKSFELPKNFTAVIVAKAESTVSGVRRPTELYNAIFICAGLSLFALFALGSEAGAVFAGAFTFFDQIAVVAGFLLYLIYSVFLGFVVVIRSVGTHFRFDVVLMIAIVSIFALLLMLISRKIMGMRRV